MKRTPRRAKADICCLLGWTVSVNRNRDLETPSGGSTTTPALCFVFFDFINDDNSFVIFDKDKYIRKSDNKLLVHYSSKISRVASIDRWYRKIE